TGELSCRAGLAALGDDEHLDRTVEMVETARSFLRENLRAQTWESGGNFVLADVSDAEAVTEEAKKQGVIVRNCSSFGLPDCIRITCGTEDHMEKAVTVLNSILERVQ
ncbi:MAG: aminotransferase class I/II-fold pyridoxal phosphate-dependent enzyme, partial [bacterium]